MLPSLPAGTWGAERRGSQEFLGKSSIQFELIGNGANLNIRRVGLGFPFCFHRCLHSSFYQTAGRVSRSFEFQLRIGRIAIAINTNLNHYATTFLTVVNGFYFLKGIPARQTIVADSVSSSARCSVVGVAIPGVPFSWPLSPLSLSVPSLPPFF